MNRMSFNNLRLTLCGGLLLCVALSTDVFSQQVSQESPAPVANDSSAVMRNYHGVGLGMTIDEVHTKLGKPNSKSKDRDEYKLDDNGLLTVHYENDKVKAIQLYYADAKNAPAWTAVVGNAEVQERPNGSKFARADVPEENFWVTMYQSKDQSVTTITISLDQTASK